MWVILLSYSFALVVQTNQMQFKHSVNMRVLLCLMSPPHGMQVN